MNKTDNAPRYELRKKTIETLHDEGFDVSLRLSPFLYETADINEINNINTDKCLIEFLRVKPSMVEPIQDYINFKDYIVKEGSYRHLPLEKKIEILDKLKFKEMTVCDDVTKHYEYFKNNFNNNKEDCCNLTMG